MLCRVDGENPIGAHRCLEIICSGKAVKQFLPWWLRKLDLKTLRFLFLVQLRRRLQKMGVKVAQISLLMLIYPLQQWSEKIAARSTNYICQAIIYSFIFTAGTYSNVGEEAVHLRWFYSQKGSRFDFSVYPFKTKGLTSPCNWYGRFQFLLLWFRGVSFHLSGQNIRWLSNKKGPSSHLVGHIPCCGLLSTLAVNILVLMLMMSGWANLDNGWLALINKHTGVKIMARLCLL